MLTAKITGKRQITIPVDICNHLELNVGDSVGFMKDNNNKYTLVKVDENKDTTCPICGKETYSFTSGVEIHRFKYHLECWFKLNDAEKVRNIISSHKITDNDCKEILKLMDNDWSRLISLYYGQLESVETDNIGELIITLLKNS